MPPSVGTQLYVTCSGSAPESLETSLNMDLGSIGSVVGHMNRELGTSSQAVRSVVNTLHDSRGAPAILAPPAQDQGVLIPATVDAEPPVAKVLIADYSAADAKRLEVSTWIGARSRIEGKGKPAAVPSGRATKLQASLRAAMLRMRNASRPQRYKELYTVSPVGIHAP
jgi:hypothetical protein